MSSCLASEDGIDYRAADFLSSPDLVVGMPVSLAICRFTLSIPNARLSENDTPGIFIFFDIIQYYYSTYTE